MAQEKWVIAPGETRVIDIDLVRKLKVGLIGGQIDIIGHDEPGARIEVNGVTGKDLKISINGDQAEIDHPQLRWDNFIEVFKNFGSNRATAEVSVLVPRDVALNIGVVTASGLVSGITADTKVNTVSGDLVIDDVTGDLDVNSVNGEITVQNHNGRINAHSVSGDVTASGRISKAAVDGVASHILLDVQGPCDSLELNSVSGSITVRLDEELPARFTTNTVSGTLTIDGSLIKGVHGKGYTAHTGTLAGQFVEVRANTVSGGITVLRRALAHATPAPGATSGDAGAGDAATSAAEASAGSAGPATDAPTGGSTSTDDPATGNAEAGA
ncbi:DUF4097 family beta strand repeat-containing protein [Plantibacter sp. YIM 135347]|uniref:DUF4097 family beta strand repeat-containing protein n=1 Tax=Plantibacter sp. YIM 135347 TaxID=3423919 RepID=UPI003D355712